MKNNRVYDLNSISKNRQCLLGVATVCILLCHSIVGSSPIAASPVLRHVLNYGNIGVDIFLFVSGVGMYYSLHSLLLNGGGIYLGITSVLLEL